MTTKKYITSEELEDKYFGKIGTPEREEYEFALNMEILGGLDSSGSQDAWLNWLLHLTQKLVKK